MEILHDSSLTSYNTFGIAAKARVFISYDNPEELVEAITLCRERYAELPMLHIGGGSNLLFLNDFDGIVLYSRIHGIEVLEESEDFVRLRVGGGMVHDDLVAYTLQHGWYGMENLSIIPGQVGASAVQNIGAYGVEACNVIERVEGISLEDGTKQSWTVDECQYAYRSSIFKTSLRGKYAITHVTYTLNKTFTLNLAYGGLQKALAERGVDAERVTAQQLRDIIIEVRNAKLPDPKVLGNAGSFFMNPVVERSVYEKICQQYPQAPHYEVDANHVKVPAGWLIEQSGWKGKALGRAAVHDKQALVLVNLGGAVGQDIVTLCETIRTDVRQQFGIDLHPEVNFIS